MRAGSPKHLSHGQHSKWETAGVLLPEAAANEPLDLADLFGNTRPVEVEIGTGKGAFLLARAGARPEVNFLGLEWAKAYCRYSADRFRRHGLRNVRMLRADAGVFFRKALSNNSLWRVHVYFPDPWPKRKHHRRRLIQPGFVEQVRRVLKVGGQWIVVTDHLGYFQHIQMVMSGRPGFVPVPMPKMSDADDEIVGTNFERKYIAQGRPFYARAWLRYAAGGCLRCSI